MAIYWAIITTKSNKPFNFWRKVVDRFCSFYEVLMRLTVLKNIWPCCYTKGLDILNLSIMNFVFGALENDFRWMLPFVLDEFVFDFFFSISYMYNKTIHICTYDKRFSAIGSSMVVFIFEQHSNQCPNAFYRKKKKCVCSHWTWKTWHKQFMLRKTHLYICVCLTLRFLTSVHRITMRIHNSCAPSSALDGKSVVYGSTNTQFNGISTFDCFH